MTPQNQWPVPKWVADLPDVEQQAAKTRFYLFLAAVYAEDRGNLSKLARLLDNSVQAVHGAVERGSVSPEMAVAIENLLGRAQFPRELFRPDLFTLPGA
jgi:hypothetical protein